MKRWNFSKSLLGRPVIVDGRKILIYPRENIGHATSILHVRRFDRGWYPGARIIRYDRSLLKSVPIKGFARKWRKLRAKGHKVERDRVRIDPAIGAAYFRGQAISDLEAAREAWRINKAARGGKGGCFAKPNKSNRHLAPPPGIIS